MDISLLGRRGSDLSILYGGSVTVEPSTTLYSVLRKLPGRLLDFFDVRTVLGPRALGKSLQCNHAINDLHFIDGDLLSVYLREKPEPIILEGYVVIPTDSDKIRPPRYRALSPPISDPVAEVYPNSHHDDQTGKTPMAADLDATPIADCSKDIGLLAKQLPNALAAPKSRRTVIGECAVEAELAKRLLLPLNGGRILVETTLLLPRASTGDNTPPVPGEAGAGIATSTLKGRGVVTLTVVIAIIEAMLAMSWIYIMTHTHSAPDADKNDPRHTGPVGALNADHEIISLSGLKSMIQLLSNKLRKIANILVDQGSYNAGDYSGQSACIHVVLQYTAALPKPGTSTQTNLHVVVPIIEPKRSSFPDAGLILLLLSITTVLGLRIYNNINYLNGNNNSVNQGIK